MSEHRSTLERELERLSPPRIPLGQLERRRERKRRDQRIRAGVVGLAVALGTAWLGVNLIESSPSTHFGETPSPTPSPTEEPAPAVGIDWESVPGVSIEEDAFVDIGTGEITRLPNSITRFGDAGGYAVAPGGEILLFEAHVDGAPGDQIFVANVDGTDLRLLTNAHGGADAGGWSPDGTKIVALTWGSGGPGESGGHVDLVLIDAATGETTQLASGPYPDFREPHFSADGQQILFGRYAHQGSHTFGIPVDGGDAALVFDDRYTAIISPDGRTIVYDADAHVFTTHGPELWLADAEGSHPRPLVPNDGPFSNTPSWSPDGTRIVYTKLRIDADELVAVVDVASGTPTFSVLAPGSRVSPVGVWLDDDTLLIDVNG